MHQRAEASGEAQRVSRLIHIGLFTIAASIGMVFALLAEIQDAHRLSGATLGVIASSSFFASVVAQIKLAPLADRGHARRLMAGAVIAASLGALGFAFADTAWQFVLARILSGLAYGAYAPAARAIVSAADPDNPGARLGSLAGLETAGFIGGPGIAALVVERSSLDVPFVAIAIILVALLPLLLQVDIPESSGRSAGRGDRPRILDLLRRRQALAAVVLSAALILPAGMYEAIFARFMTDIGAETWFIGLSLSLYGVPFVLTAPLAGRAADRMGPLRVIPMAVVVIVPLTIVYGYMTTPGMLMSLAMFEAVANGAAMPASQALMASATKDGERAMGQGLAAAAGQIAAGIAALIAAPLYAARGPEITFTTVAVAVLLMTTIGMAIGLSGAARARRVPSGIGRGSSIPEDGR